MAASSVTATGEFERMDQKAHTNGTTNAVSRSREGVRTLRSVRGGCPGDLAREFAKALKDMRQADWLELCELF
jgi:hypothetical protein